VTAEQMERLLASLRELHRLSEERDAAQQAQLFAARQWNSARLQYAAKHAEISAEFGQEYAPQWIEALHGPRTQ